jgi:hypothetical protein|nr:MAG TPA: zinc-ribbon domain protein [Caudoviricetes sp.]
MPEPYWPKRKGSYALSDADKNRALLRGECRYCKIVHFYLASDMKEVCGDVQVDDVKLRCEKCGQTDIPVTCYHPTATEYPTLMLRRLERIEFKRRIIWRDEPAWKRQG